MFKKLLFIQSKIKKIFKKVTLCLLKTLPFNSEIIGPPRSFYKKTLDCKNEFILRKNYAMASYVDIHSTCKLNQHKPKTLYQYIHWQFRRETITQYESPLYESVQTFVAVLYRGRVVGNKGAVITPDDKLLADVSIEYGVTPNNPQAHSIFSAWKISPASIINGSVAVLSVSNGNNYYHWMFDVLPRIELIRLSGIDVNYINKFVINKIRLSFQNETLLSIGISKDKIVEANAHTHIKADQLIVPSLPNYRNVPLKWVCDFLNREFSSKDGKTASEHSDRLYVSRAKARYRKVTNEFDVIKLLNSLGFEVVTLESMTVAEQALLFSKAKVIVAPHGAGLTNLAFCNSDVKVIEVFSPNYVSCCYWVLSNCIDAKYYYLLGEGNLPPENVDPFSFMEDIIINIERLSDTLKYASIK